MAPVPITDAVLAQLAAVLEGDEIADPNARFAVHAVAVEAGYEALATFIVEADAVRYSRALERLDGADRLRGR